MAKQISTRSSKITCLCGAVTEPGSLLVADNFPISAGFCSCSVCRQSTGALGIIPIHLTGQPSSKSLAACSTYIASERGERYFCATCGSHVFLRYSEVDMWMTIAGVIDREDEAIDVDTVKVTKIGFLSETLDGGLAERMRSVALKSEDNTFADVKCYAQMPLPETDVPLVSAHTLWQASTPSTEQDKGNIFCSCHCGKAQVQILRPDDSRNNLEKVARMLRANRSKYVAKLCVCRSCRFATSTTFMPWTYVMPENILTPDGKRINFDFNTNLEDLAGAQVYISKDTRRSFCSTCGATLFYEHKDRPELIDISLGIFRSRRGVLAEDVLEWDWPWVSWKDSGRDNEFLRSLTAE